VDKIHGFKTTLLQRPLDLIFVACTKDCAMLRSYLNAFAIDYMVGETGFCDGLSFLHNH